MDKKTDREIIWATIKHLKYKKNYTNIIEDDFWKPLTKDKRIHIRSILFESNVAKPHPYNNFDVSLTSKGLTSKELNYDSDGYFRDKIWIVKHPIQSALLSVSVFVAFSGAVFSFQSWHLEKRKERREIVRDSLNLQSKTENQEIHILDTVLVKNVSDTL